MQCSTEQEDASVWRHARQLMDPKTARWGIMSMMLSTRFTASVETLALNSMTPPSSSCFADIDAAPGVSDQVWIRDIFNRYCNEETNYCFIHGNCRIPLIDAFSQ